MGREVDVVWKWAVLYRVIEEVYSKEVTFVWAPDKVNHVDI